VETPDDVKEIHILVGDVRGFLTPRYCDHRPGSRPFAARVLCTVHGPPATGDCMAQQRNSRARACKSLLMPSVYFAGINPGQVAKVILLPHG
jgi:hypothetical protein